MDGKRRGKAGFLNGKLMRWSLYRATTANRLPLSSATKAKPNRSPITTADHGGYIKTQDHLRSHQSHNNIIVNQTSFSYYPPTTDIAKKTAASSYSAANMDALYGGIAVDEEIDRKAANYISSVRERFRLGNLN